MALCNSKPVVSLDVKYGTNYTYTIQHVFYIALDNRNHLVLFYIALDNINHLVKFRMYSIYLLDEFQLRENNSLEICP